MVLVSHVSYIRIYKMEAAYAILVITKRLQAHANNAQIIRSIMDTNVSACLVTQDNIMESAKLLSFQLV